MNTTVLEKLSVAILLSMPISTRIKEVRKLRNLSQRALADKINVTDSAISQYETGQTEPTIKNLSSIAIAVDCSFEWLATGRGEKEIEDFLQQLAQNYKKDKRLILLNDDRAELLELIEKLPDDWRDKYKYVIELTVNSLDT